MAEKVEIIEIDTGQSGKTLKELKDEIKSLRSELDKCEIGTDKFTATLEDLTAAQNELKNATKTSNQALAGSYDALTQKMGELKKMWKATADEAKRAELGEEIAKINQQLKDMDESIGNHQRKVGDYGSAFDDLSLKVGENGLTFERLTKTSQDVIGSFDVLEGGLKACGIESEAVTGLMDKLSGAMKMTQGFKSVKEGAGAFTALKTTAAGATSAIGGLSVGLVAAAGALASVVAGAFALIGNLDKLKHKFRDVTAEEEAARAAAELNKELVEISKQTSADKITRLKELSMAYQQLGDDMDAKQGFVESYREELEDMGIALDDINIADEVFINNTQAYVKAITARAKADALREKAKEDYAKFLVEEARLEAELTDALQRQSSGTPKKSFWQNLGEAIIGASVFEGANVHDTRDLQDAWTAEIAQKAVDAAQANLDNARNSINAEIEKSMNKAAGFDKEADEVLGVKKTKAAKTAEERAAEKAAREAEKAAEKAAREAEEARKRAEQALANANAIAEKARKSLIDTREEELNELKRVYEAEKAILEQNGIDTTTLTEAYEKNKLEIAERYAKKEEELAKITAEAKKKIAEELVADSRERLNETIAAIDKDAEQQMYLNERQKPKNNNEVAGIENEMQKIDTLKQIYKQVEEDSVAAIEKEQSLFEESSARWIELEQQKITIKEQTSRRLAELDDQYATQHKAKMKSIATNTMSTFSSALSSASQIISAVQETIDTTSKEGFEKNKKLQIVNATISMLTGIVNAISSSMQLPQPMGAILAAINAATVATVGGIQIAQIKKQTYEGAKTDSDTSAQIPQVNTAALLSTPVNYTTEVKGAQAVEDAVDTRVYVVESDISDTIRKVETAESESVF